MTCQLGSHKAPIAHMKEKAQGWVDLAISANLPCWSLWFLANRQFVPKVFFGISLNSATYTILAECLMKQYNALVPLGGVCRLANQMVQQLDRGFFGFSCPHPAIECLPLQTTKMLTHYGCETAVGRLLQPSVALLKLELGMGSQPFTVDFLKCGARVMDSWVKSLWEKVFIFGITLEEGRLNICPPRERDEWIMPMLVRLGCTALELLRLNQVRVHQEVLFLSDVMGARGTVIDKRYEYMRNGGEKWSRFSFPWQSLPKKGFRLWRQALLQLRYARSSPTLGRFLEEGQKIWDWRYLKEENQLFQIHAGGMEIYTPSDVPRYANHPNCWTRSRVDQPVHLCGDICTVLKVALGVWKIWLRAPTLQVTPAPESLEDVFRKWSCTWLWDDIKWQGDANWLRESILNEQCIVVADGAYMPHIQTDLCSTAFFFAYTAGHGRLVGSFAEFLTALNAYRGK
jgi:hypothetical protein